MAVKVNNCGSVFWAQQARTSENSSKDCLPRMPARRSIILPLFLKPRPKWAGTFTLRRSDFESSIVRFKTFLKVTRDSASSETPLTSPICFCCLKQTIREFTFPGRKKYGGSRLSAPGRWRVAQRNSIDVRVVE